LPLIFSVHRYVLAKEFNKNNITVIIYILKEK